MRSFPNLATGALMLFGVVLADTSFAAFPKSLGDGHFFVAKSSEGFLPFSPTETDCKARIRSIMCLAENYSDGAQNRECLPGGEAYAFHFEKLYDNVPPMLQQVFCALKVIYIEKNFFGTAYAGALPGGGAMMGVRQSVLDGNLSLARWASWKEQLSFGGKDSVDFEVRSDLPQIRTTSNSDVSDFLYFLVAHEFGHILDFAKKLNRVKEDCPPSFDDVPECEMAEGSWGAISWSTNKKPKSENDFAQRAGLCFYSCEGNVLPFPSVAPLYESLMNRTDFISAYAATQPWDDFADSLAYFLMQKNLGTTYFLDTRQGSTYDVMEKLSSPAFAKKREYLERLMRQ